jgi:hypothetical protein
MTLSSFSETTKVDLAQVTGERPCCLLSELAGFARVASRSAGEPGGERRLEIRTENAAVARKTFRLVRAVFTGTVGVSTRQRRRFREKKLFLIRVPGEFKRTTAKLGLSDRFGKPLSGIKSVFLRRECCRRSYLRGLFLGAGWVGNTVEGYHLELLTPSAVLAQDIVALLQRFGLKARYIKRKHSFVVYLKESAAICDFLKLMGATGAILSLENARVYREVKNRINRLVNCETANLTKTVEASLRRKHEINLIMSKTGIESLPLELRELARLRLAHPDATLKELGELLNPPVSKSCVNHRLRNLAAIAGRLRRSAGGSVREGS